MAAKRRRRKRRRGGNVFLSLLTFCMIIGAIIGSVTVFLKVAEVKVTGSTRYDPADIVETSGIRTGDNMFMINKFDVAERILNEYPYIEQIKIRRKLPDTFTFEITERVAAAYVECNGNRWLIDNNAYILEMISPDTTVQVPKITGGEVLTPRSGSEIVLKQPEQLPVLKEVLSALRYTDMNQNISRVEIDKLYDINLVYGDRFLVVLGDTSSLFKKMEMLRAVIGELSDFDKGTINVSAVKEARFKPDARIDLSEKPQPATSDAEAEQTTLSAETENSDEKGEDEGSEDTN